MIPILHAPQILHVVRCPAPTVLQGGEIVEVVIDTTTVVEVVIDTTTVVEVVVCE